MNLTKQKNVLVCPLDWGLGHATRCIPVIRELLNRDCSVSVGGSGESLALLRLEFPQLSYYEFPSYGVVYSKWKFIMPALLLVQLPKIRRAARKENTLLQKLVSAHNFDLIISDNRYGCYSQEIKSVFICHQLNIKFPRLLFFASPLANFYHRTLIKKFSVLWVPDFSDHQLSGSLSLVNSRMFRFIGALSRFSQPVSRPKKYKVLAVLSGPEPHRSIFESKLLSELTRIDGPCALVRGMPGQQIIQTTGNITKFSHLNASNLQQIIEESEVVVCRSGYSSIMDLTRLKARVIFIPTPGQTEQEYLAAYQQEVGRAGYQTQDRLDLMEGLKDLEKYKGFAGIVWNDDLLSQAILDVLR